MEVEIEEPAQEDNRIEVTENENRRVTRSSILQLEIGKQLSEMNESSLDGLIKAKPTRNSNGSVIDSRVSSLHLNPNYYYNDYRNSHIQNINKKVKHLQNEKGE